MTRWPDRIAWWGLAFIVCQALAPPLYKLSRAVEKYAVQLDRECAVGVPEKPIGKGWHLVWQEQKPKTRK